MNSCGTLYMLLLPYGTTVNAYGKQHLLISDEHSFALPVQEVTSNRKQLECVQYDTSYIKCDCVTM